MKRTLVSLGLSAFFAFGAIGLACGNAGSPAAGKPAGPPAAMAPLQFLPEELALRARWEEFLEKAEVVGKKQMSGSEAVTSPWVLTLKLGDVTHRGLWWVK